MLASARTTGLAGAYAALAEGVDGDRANAAAPAVRRAWSRRWFEPTLSLSMTFPGTLARTDFDNDGQVGFTYEDFTFVTSGLNLAFGPWGFGLAVDAQHYALSGIAGPGAAERSLELALQRGHLLGARALFGGQLVVGGGAQIASLTLTPAAAADESGAAAFAMSSAGFEAGALWAPLGLPLRLGLSGRAPTVSHPDPENAVVANAAGDTRLGPFTLPERLACPWELEFGWAVQLGPRPLNTRWQNPRRALAPLRQQLAVARATRSSSAASGAAAGPGPDAARLRAARRQFRADRRAVFAALPRQKVLLSMSWLLSGPVADGVGLESFLRQTVQRSGQRATLTPRLGAEIEPVPHWLQVRGGSYLEPSRFERGSARLHGTAGFDVRLFRFGAFGLFDPSTQWRLGGYLDGARDYLAWGFTAGIWR